MCWIVLGGGGPTHSLQPPCIELLLRACFCAVMLRPLWCSCSSPLLVTGRILWCHLLPLSVDGTVHAGAWSSIISPVMFPHLSSTVWGILGGARDIFLKYLQMLHVSGLWLKSSSYLFFQVCVETSVVLWGVFVFWNLWHRSPTQANSLFLSMWCMVGLDLIPTDLPSFFF